MEIGIEADTRVSDIQNQFTAWYPCLKLEFVLNPRHENNALLKIQKVNSDQLISAIGLFTSYGKINMDGKKTVVQIVKEFKERFGLSVQVFRKSGNLWIETSLTNDWTLEKQNMVEISLNTRDESSLPEKGGH